MSEDTQSSVANSTKVAEEVVSSMATVRSFANEPTECKRYREELEEFYELNLKQVCVEVWVCWAVLMCMRHGLFI